MQARNQEVPQGKKAGANGTIYQLVTGLGSDKKQLLMTRLLNKGAVGLMGPSGVPHTGLPMRSRVDFYGVPSRLPPLSSGPPQL